MPLSTRDRKEHAALERRLLKLSLAAVHAGLVPRCVECGRTENDTYKGKPVVLSFDHIGPTRDWDCRQTNETTAIKRYQEEADRNELQLLCVSCNSRKGQPSDPNATYTAADQWEPEENIIEDGREVPF